MGAGFVQRGTTSGRRGSRWPDSATPKAHHGGRAAARLAGWRSPWPREHPARLCRQSATDRLGAHIPRRAARRGGDRRVPEGQRRAGCRLHREIPTEARSVPGHRFGAGAPWSRRSPADVLSFRLDPWPCSGALPRLPRADPPARGASLLWLWRSGRPERWRGWASELEGSFECPQSMQQRRLIPPARGLLVPGGVRFASEYPLIHVQRARTMETHAN